MALSYTLKRSKKRRTLGLKINAMGDLFVHVPYFVPQYEIDKFVDNNQSWILRKQNEMQSRQKAKLDVSRSEFWYLGQRYKLLRTVHSDSIIFSGDQVFLPLSFSQEDMDNWLKQRAEDILYDRVSIFEKYIPVKPQKVSVRKLKSRWGSCSSRANISLNLQLIKAPMFVVDYVVVHELSHLVHLNHSRHFWHLVESILPDYKKAHTWLKENGHLL